MKGTKKSRNTEKIPLHQQNVSKSDKIITSFIILVIGIAAVALLFAAKNVFFPASAAINQNQQSPSHFGSGGFTEYDLALAKNLMDKNGDGICDICGMSVDFCIQSGQLQCNIGDDGNEFRIGPLDTSKQKHHYHADFKVFLNGEPVDFNQAKYFVKSRFVHVENDPQGDSGEVLHMHAEGVPLWLFFESLDMQFSEDCFALDTGEEYCNDELKSLKFFVNGQPNEAFEDYVFRDGDKILVSYGPRGQDVSSELGAVTDHAKNH